AARMRCADPTRLHLLHHRVRMKRRASSRAIAVLAVTIALTPVAAGNRAARASALTDETRAAFTKGAAESCFEGQSKHEANRSRKPEQLRSLCSCVAEKASYTMTMEGVLARASKPSPSTQEEERVLRAIFDNCCQVNMK